MKPIAHTWPRFVSMAVVCVCAIYATWWQTHPKDQVRTLTHVVQVKQGDGLLTEGQCRSIKNGAKISDLRKRYGLPKDDMALEYAWNYPLRGDEKRHCDVSWSDHYGLFRLGHRVDEVRLELVVS